VLNGMVFRDDPQQVFELMGFQEGGGATSEIYCVQRFALEVVALKYYFLTHSRDKFPFDLHVRGEVKITIVAGLFAKRDMKINSSHNWGQTYVHFGHSHNSYSFALMWPRILFVFFFFYSSVFAQEKFTAIKDLRSEWTTCEAGVYQAVTAIPFAGLNTVYFEMDPRSFAGNYLLLRSDRPYFLFVNGKIRGEYQEQVLLNIDSLAKEIHSASFRIAVHQKNINERDLRTEVISMKPTRVSEEGTAERPYSYFRDFVVIAGLIIILLFLLVFRLHPKLASDYFSIIRIFSSRDIDDGQASSRLTSSSNIQFYILCSLVLGMYLLIVLYNLPPEYALPLPFQSTGFWMIVWQWLKISAIIFSVLVMKLLIIFFLTRLFGLRGLARYHFFNWIRLLLVIFGGATVLLFMYFISRGDRPDIFVFFLSLVVITLIAWIVLAFLKLSGKTGHSMFHLFSYLCATEIIPLLITTKVLFQ